MNLLKKHPGRRFIFCLCTIAYLLTDKQKCFSLESVFVRVVGNRRWCSNCTRIELKCFNTVYL